MNLYNFNPINKNILINGGSYELSPFTIKMICLVNYKYNSLSNFDKILTTATDNKETGIYTGLFPDTIAWLAYELITEQDYFESVCDFKKKFFDQPQAYYEYNVNNLFLTIQDSQPILTEYEIDELIKKAKTTIDGGEVEEIDQYFSKSYAAISKEIKFTIEEFYNLTIRQINQIADDLNIIKTKDLDFIAKLHGQKLIKQSDNRPNVNFSKKESNDINQFAAKRMEEIKNERANL